MKTTVLASCTPEDEAMLAERRRLGQDRLDEVWQGEYHMVPGPHSRHGLVGAQLLHLLHDPARDAGLSVTLEFNVGEPDDFRVPDMGYHRGRPDAVYLPTAAIVVEVASPGDESWLKFDFYAAHRVDEVVIVDPATETIHWFALGADGYLAVGRSAMLDLEVTAIAGAMDW